MATVEGAPGPGIIAGDGVAVERTGLAVVHQGERILAAPASQAALSRSAAEAGRAIEVVFPVEIEVQTPDPEAHLDRLADLVLHRLTQGLMGS
jgi:hypothetical protein